MPDRLRAALRRYAQSDAPISRGAPATRTVAVQSIPTPLYFGLMACLAADVKRRHDAAIDLVVVRSTGAAFGTGIMAAIRRSAPLNWLKTLPWNASFGRLADRIAYRASSWSHPIFDLRALWSSRRIWQAWRQMKHDDQPDWAAQSVANVVCGDLVIDTFLRFNPSPRFDVDNPLVWQILWQTMRDEYRARRYFRRRRPCAYLTSYATYIEHGIPLRVALQENIPVVTFGDLSLMGYRPTLNRPVHVRDCSHYRVEFQELSPQQQAACLDEAERLLKFRLSGGIDPATSYMRSSAYATKSTPVPGAPDWKGAAVIFLHDFYDSPHVWPELVFTDFWEWICCTIETLDSAGLPYFIKPHPNQIALSDGAVLELKAKYPHVRWLDPSTNNADLARAPIACGITVYGTIAHELAYLGVPSIGAAAHPHLAFDFCRRARSRAEYVELLQDFASRPLSDEEMRRQALQFYSMHNNLHRPETAALAAAFSGYYAAMASGAAEADPQTALSALKELRGQPGYDTLIQSLVEQSG